MSNIAYYIICWALAVASYALAVFSEDISLAWLCGMVSTFVMLMLGYYLKKP